MRNLVAILFAALAAVLAPAAATAATPRCVEIAGIKTCPGTPVTPGPSETCEGKDVRPSVRGAARARAATLCLINVERGKRGIDPLRASTPLRSAAERFARRMVRHDFFAHEGPSGDTLRDRVKRTSYLSGARRWSLGENLAYGSGARATPAQIVGAWMRSPGHRRNMLDAGFEDVGIGIVTGLPVRRLGSGSTYVTDFGAR